MSSLLADRLDIADAGLRVAYALHDALADAGLALRLAYSQRAVIASLRALSSPASRRGFSRVKVVSAPFCPPPPDTPTPRRGGAWAAGGRRGNARSGE